jgi:L,D-peptidoglycan transpeptidase YkuD (ErfK/YbiS/YcfS/YnhG family)
MDLDVFADGTALWTGRRFRCAIGNAGISVAKQEGDGRTPAGRWTMRRVLYRSDRMTAPTTSLTAAAILPEDGWCDAPADAAYNRPVRLPYPASAERLWREDEVYDLIVPLGYNDAPVRAGAGSAIFLHVARPAYAPTEGCVALARADLLAVLRAATPASAVVVHAARRGD